MVRKLLLVILIVLFIPVFLVAFVSIHELGHVSLARLMGDPEAVYYLVRIEQGSRSFGQTLYDESKLSWTGHLLTTLGGLLATQSVALVALLLLRLSHHPRWLGNAIGAIALAFLLLDLPFQVYQALAYDRPQRAWPTGVDLMDVMLLLQMQFPLGLDLLKALLLAAAVLYLALFLWLYRRTMAWQDAQKTRPLA